MGFQEQAVKIGWKGFC